MIHGNSQKGYFCKSFQSFVYKLASSRSYPRKQCLDDSLFWQLKLLICKETKTDKEFVEGVRIKKKVF